MKKSTFNTPLDAIAATQIVGRSLKVLRKRRGFTQEDVALRIGVSRDVVLHAEQGKSVSSQHLFAMLWLYGVLQQAIDSVSPSKDVVGLSIEISRLPERVRKEVRKSNAEF